MENGIALKRPDEKTRDSGKLRLGDCMVSFEVPTLRRPDETTRDSGKLRIGDCLIAGRY